MSLMVRVRSLAGCEICACSADSTWSVVDVKEFIENSIGFPKNRQRLLLGARTLRDDDRISSVQDEFLREAGIDCDHDGHDEELDLVLIRLSELKLEWIRRVKIDGLHLRLAPDSPRYDPVVTLAAVKQNGLALGCAAPELQRDREIVEAAVRQNGLALMFAAPELKADHAIALAAVRENRAALSCVGLDLKENAEFLSAVGAE